MIKSWFIENSETIITIMGGVFIYIGTELLKWFKSKKSNVQVKSDVTEILERQKVFHDTITTKVESIEKDVADVKKEVMYNGGSSLKDQINEIKGLQEARFFWQQNQNETALYNCDKNGDCTFANKTLCDLFGLHYTEMIGRGWLKAIGTTHRERSEVYSAWIASIKENIPFECEYIVVNQQTGVEVKCITKAEAMRNKNGQVMYYIGTVHKLN